MNSVRTLLSELQSFFIIFFVYVLCHGVTALLVTPVQQMFLSEVTAFASLVYLPHGVRVLSTWLVGWRALFPLAAGAMISELAFTSADLREVMQPVILLSIAVGAVSAWLAFLLIDLFRRGGVNADQRINWKWLIVVGAIASVINSVGQSLVFSGLILPDHLLAVLVTYAIGDLIGLVVCMVAAMLIFRWVRLYVATNGGGPR
ncbi:hypothetical protein [Albibacillus kandeliae]|uniref:hypothetical protein n=1 Tax=Albibacillus kandeliae TaxID=2174228 RepID=UPI000D693E68|nr:hypothetical protein [Albibacillus kandeliae]